MMLIYFFLFMTTGLKKVTLKQTLEIKLIIQILKVNERKVNERKVQSMFMNFVPK